MVLIALSQVASLCLCRSGSDLVASCFSWKLINIYLTGFLMVHGRNPFRVLSWHPRLKERAALAHNRDVSVHQVIIAQDQRSLPCPSVLSYPDDPGTIRTTVPVSCPTGGACKMNYLVVETKTFTTTGFLVSWAQRSPLSSPDKCLMDNSSFVSPSSAGKW